MIEKNEKRDYKGIFIRLCGYVLRYWFLFVPAVIITLLSNQLSLFRRCNRCHCKGGWSGF